MNPSGLKIGIPALTTQSIVEENMRKIARVIVTALSEEFEAERKSLLKPQHSTRGSPALTT